MLYGEFKKDIRLSEKRGLDIELLKTIISDLVNETPLNEKHRDHALTGNYKGYRECHISPDWLLVYYVEGNIITFARTGTHSYAGAFSPPSIAPIF